MITASLSKGPRRATTVTVLLCFALAPVMVIGTAAPVHSAPATALRLDPATAQIASGETLTLALWVDDVEDLERVELHLDYDWASLEVQDADPELVSVQIEPGPIFDTACALWNEAVNGQIHFVAQRDSAAGPFSGSDIAAYITLLVTATEPATYTVSFDQAAIRLLDDESAPFRSQGGDGTPGIIPAAAPLKSDLQRAHQKERVDMTVVTAERGAPHRRPQSHGGQPALQFAAIEHLAVIRSGSGLAGQGFEQPAPLGQESLAATQVEPAVFAVVDSFLNCVILAGNQPGFW